MIRRLWPSSLAGQLMLVTALALMIAQSVNFVALVAAQRDARLASIAGGAAAQIADATERINAGQPIGFGGRDWAAARAARERPDGTPGPRHGRMILDTVPHIPSGMRNAPELAARVRGFLAETGTRFRAVLVVTGGAHAPRHGPQIGPRREVMAVVVATQLSDGRWLTIRGRVPAMEQPIGTLLIVQTLVLFVLMLGPLLWTAWRVARPLARLSTAARDVRPGVPFAPVPESGPGDVRSLTRAFNAMHERITRLLADKDRMLGAVGHDLRTPLASLRVRVEQVDDPALRERMIATIAEMTVMLEDILSLVRADSQRDAPDATDLAALASAVVDDYRAMNQPVSLAPTGVVLVRRVHAAGLRRALRNLVDNALGYGGSAVIGLEQDATGQALLTVDDDGPGIPADQIAAMMEPFARGEQSRNRATGGSGLGLSLAKSVVTAEGGTLSLVNRPGGGLRATISLPSDA